MALISAYHFFTLMLLVSLAAMPAQSDRLNPEIEAGCWKEIYQVPQCVFHIIKALISNSSIEELGVHVGVPCCRAFISLTGDCKVEIFKNSTTISTVETFCTAIVAAADAPPLPPVVETPAPVVGLPLAPTPLHDVDMEKRTSTFPWPNVRLV
ncbi:hypothetical protein LINGRAHAP2_LOCUS25923 [Linum grandiflorum]